MFKKIMASAAVAVSVVGVSAAAAPSAMAIANDGGTTTVNGNGASQAYGNSETHGDWSPQFALIQGSLNKPCIALPAKANLGSQVLFGLMEAATAPVARTFLITINPSRTGCPVAGRPGQLGTGCLVPCIHPNAGLRGRTARERDRSGSAFARL
ncbi:hypothetical protein SMICM17S_08865 [Streptomyces microflavus]